LRDVEHLDAGRCHVPSDVAQALPMAEQPELGGIAEWRRTKSIISSTASTASGNAG
jgi:hypothetical protein